MCVYASVLDGASFLIKNDGRAMECQSKINILLQIELK